MIYVPGDTPPPRAAFAVNKRVGNAVVRNRVRRRLRSILREEADRPDAPLASGAYLLVAREGIADVGYDELRRHVTAACAAAADADGRP